MVARAPRPLLALALLRSPRLGSAAGARSPDYALYLETGLGHLTTSHQLFNLTAEAQRQYGRVNVYTAPAEAVRQPVNVLDCTLRDISVPAHARGSLSATCTFPFDLDMVILSSHAHQHLTRFEMRVFDGEETPPEVIHESTQWTARRSSRSPSRSTSPPARA